MSPISDPKQYSEAVLEQLNAEIGLKSGINDKVVAQTIGMDYNTFRRYMRGERKMPLNVFWAVLGALQIDEDVFLTRVKSRLPGA